MRVRLILSFSGLTLVSIAGTASAHLRLQDDPPARYATPANETSGDMLKSGPCGVTGDSRTTDATRITTYTPGETITVKFKETVEHAGHYRISFDSDGQDSFVNPSSKDDIQTTPVLPVLKDGIMDADPSNANQLMEVQVTLPNITCQNCTLQVIQLMTDKAFADAFYYQCADIKIEGPLQGGGGTGGTGGAGGSGGSGGVAMGGVAGATGGVPGTGGAAGTAPSGGVSNGGTTTAAAGMRAAPAAPADDSGCSVNAASGDSGGKGAFLASALLLGLGLLGARRPSGGRARRPSGGRGRQA